MFLKNKALYDICKIVEDKWDYSSIYKRKSLINSLYKALQKEYTGLWINDGIKNINQLNIIKKSNSIIAEYNSTTKELYLNENKFNIYKYESNLLKVLLHEIYHSYQNTIYNIDDNNIYSNLYFNKIIKIDKYDNLHTYTHLINENNKIGDLSKIFYYLNPIEREAFINSEKVAILYNKNIEYTIPDIIVMFNYIYKTNYTQEKIFTIIDDCYDRLYKQNYINMTEITASVIYDLQQIILLENDKLSYEEVKQNLQDKYNITKSLYKYNECPYITDIEKFKKLNDIQQANNSKVVIKAILNMQEKVIPYIENKEILNNIIEFYEELLTDKCKETINYQMKNLTNRENKQNHILDEK